MKIHVLAQKTGLTASTIRFYEQEELLDTRHVQREENNYRNYSEEAVDQLQMIKKFQSAGFTLTELKEVIQEGGVSELPLAKKIELVRQKIWEMERKKKN